MSQCGGKRVNLEKLENTMQPLVTVVTVVYNNVRGIEKTMDSVLAQRNADFEYIVIDGNSNDGTIDLIRSRSELIDYWVSEPDNGLYEAMNKALYLARGEWIVYLMSGDYFQSTTVVHDVFSNVNTTGFDVVFGNAIEEWADGTRVFIKPSTDSNCLLKAPTYRHGASFVRTEVHRKYPFDIERKKDLGYALDYDMIYRMCKNGVAFKYVDLYVLTYEREGMSFRPMQNLKYINLITRETQSLKDCIMYHVKIAYHTFIGHSIGRAFVMSVSYFFTEILLNGLFDKFYLRSLRVMFCRLLGMKVGQGVILEHGVRIVKPRRIRLGDNVRVNYGSLLDGTGTLVVENGVIISSGAQIVSDSNELKYFESSRVIAPIVIGAGSLIGSNSIILPGVTVLSGTLVSPDSVVGVD